MKTIINLFESSVNAFPNNVFMMEKRGDVYTKATYSEIHQRVHRFAAGLMALGLQKGDRVALISEGCNDWAVSELGILYNGAINVPLSVKLLPDEIDFRIKHSQSRIIIVSAFQSKKLESIDKSIVDKIIFVDKIAGTDKKEISFEDVLKLGDEFLLTKKELYDARWKSVQENDVANICYTSGTTADPKGIMLSHKNYVSNTEQAVSLFNIPSNFVTLLILPWDHAFAHTAGVYTFMRKGSCIASVQIGNTPLDALKNIPTNIKEIKPHLLMSVPALAKNFKKNIENGIRAKGSVAETLFNTGLKVAYAYNGNGFNKGSGVRFLLKPLVKLFDKILFSKIRENFGGRLQYFVGGGALLDIELQRFFYAIGLPMYQGYGLTEAAPVISANSTVKHKFGTSGYIADNMEVKICDDTGNDCALGEKGEIVVRGENVMLGYWKNDEATAQTLINGWLYTGDMGTMDKDGFLYVFGRFKSLLIADDGEKYSPEGLEEAFVGQSAYIDQIMLYNNQNAYTIALIVPSKDALKRYAKEKELDLNVPETKNILLRLIENELLDYRTGKKHGHMFPQRWLPASIGIVNQAFTEENHMLNSTLKIVRNKIVEYNQDFINYLYTSESKNICNDKNIRSIENWLNPN